MGYVAPTKNEQAVQYGSRDAAKTHAVQKVSRIEPAKWQRLQRQEEQNAYKLEEQEALLRKRREIEKKLYGKGHRFDRKA
ncbi:hypothetical protein SAMN05192534_11031 [Alteribacillus persepolensis]|uniref:Uncharacterized protein n=1 Tax=Alteribacillus persepolensis TaxID=568899 RepID=A0A1G8ER75_9BACI|nr:hypothetical protein [Alteribacillus persepolensis]SDH72362.1 hypothetical protein SAMN05192534_11031 [Alteribacillus persepolensis]